MPAKADERDEEIARLKERVEKLEKVCNRLLAEKEAAASDQAQQTAKTSLVATPASGFVPEGEKQAPPAETKQRKEATEKEWAVGAQTRFESIAWKNALLLESQDKAFRMHLGGRMHVDAAWWSAPENVMYGNDGVGALDDGVAFRRARLRAAGTLYETVHFVTEYGFETGSPVFFDVFGEVTHLPYAGNLRIGHFREPFSMDALTSGNFLTFIERSLIQDAFVPFRNTGMMAFNTILEERGTWSLGVFRANSNGVGADGGDGDYAMTGRLTLMPWSACQGDCMLHVGAAGSVRNLPDLNSSGSPVLAGGLGRVRFATRPEIRPNAPNFADTGLIVANSLSLGGLEMGLGIGPFLLQAEFVYAHVRDAITTAPATPMPQVGNLGFHGGYVQASCFLTGEVRPYVPTQGVFGQPIPHENFFCVVGAADRHDILWGRGAWETGVRYSFIDLNDQAVAGGTLHDLTFGLNWYWNPNARVMWNYILAWRNSPEEASSGLTQIFAARFQVDF